MGEIPGIRQLPLAGDERSEDIGRAFSDSVHLRVADQLLDAERRVSTKPLRIGCFVSHASENDLGVF